MHNVNKAKRNLEVIGKCLHPKPDHWEQPVTREKALKKCLAKKCKHYSAILGGQPCLSQEHSSLFSQVYL